MAKPIPTKKDRNSQIYKDYKSGKYTTSELVAKYDLSTARIYYIVNRQKEIRGE